MVWFHAARVKYVWVHIIITILLITINRELWYIIYSIYKGIFGVYYNNVQHEKGRPLPKFGEWDVNNPASADGFTVIFAKARDEKKAKGTAVGAGPPPSSETEPHQPCDNPRKVFHSTIFSSIKEILTSMLKSLLPITVYWCRNIGYAVSESWCKADPDGGGGCLKFLCSAFVLRHLRRHKSTPGVVYIHPQVYFLGELWKSILKCNSCLFRQLDEDLDHITTTMNP